MQIKALAPLLVLTVATLAHGSQSATEWVKYAPDDLRFSVLFPRQPKNSTAPVTNNSGEKFTQHLSESLDASGSSYTLGVADYPFTIDPQKSLDAARGGMIEGVKGTLLREYSVPLDGHPGREFMVSARAAEVDVLVQARIYVVGNRLYMLVYVYQKLLDPEAAAKNAARFFGSFKLTAGK